MKADIAWLEAVLLWGGAATIVGGVVTGVVRVGRALVRAWGRVDSFLTDWYGEPERPGVPARPGMMQRVGGIETRLGGVEHELHPNEGSSLRDAVDQANVLLRRLCLSRPEPDGPPPPTPRN